MTIVKTNLAKLPEISSARLKGMMKRADQSVDYSDIAELDDSFWQDAVFQSGKEVKVPVALRLKPEVLAWFKAQGEGHTSRMAAILQKFYEHHQRS